MEELGLFDSIVEEIRQRAGERPVRKVRVRVGRLRHVEAQEFERSFHLAAAGTVADGAKAELLLLPVLSRCRACGFLQASEEIPVVCPECHSIDVELTGGDELVLELIEY
ncbi:MAG TPA: hydrogenase maturation nickel metallochaperone HypA [Acidimicrobiales bacterium]|nr:hydrogenase maturation nickel metallochaperone HypA [Acidimicrobiales bacterium]